MQSRTSLIIPVLDDAETLASLLRRVRRWRRPPDEILVVCGGRNTDVEIVARNHACKFLRSTPSRGMQLDVGARAAAGDVLWFLHADASPLSNSLRAIEAALRSGAVGGCFRFEFAGPETWYKRLLAGLIAVRIRMGGTAYGDQGLFCLHDSYLECGGFPPQPLFEEVELVRRLRRLGPFTMLDTPIWVSTRRWERDGWLKRTLQNRLLALGFMLGVSPATLSGIYHRADAARPLRSSR
jgi:rSAM/selenodomain-associated transferase 2